MFSSNFATESTFLFEETTHQEKFKSVHRFDGQVVIMLNHIGLKKRNFIQNLKQKKLNYLRTLAEPSAVFTCAFSESVCAVFCVLQTTVVHFSEHIIGTLKSDFKTQQKDRSISSHMSMKLNNVAANASEIKIMVYLHVRFQGTILR
jgi:hypothetical protein